MSHAGRHHCTIPGCSGFDRPTFYRRIEKSGVQVVQLLGSRPMVFYTVGLSANHDLPELFIQTNDVGSGGAGTIAAMLACAADYLTALKGAGVAIGPGLRLPSAISPRAVWLWDDDPAGTMRREMGGARDYYRDVHLRRLESVPVFQISPKPHPCPRPEVDDAFIARPAGGILDRILVKA